MKSAQQTPQTKSDISPQRLESSADELTDLFSRLLRVRTRALTQAAELRRFAEDARDTDAFAVGDGATDADVSPSNERRSVHVWPGQ